MINALTVNALTVDVEDYFQVEAFADAVPRAAWDSMPRRVEASTDRVMELFARADAVGTFFTLGWVAERIRRWCAASSPPATSWPVTATAISASTR